VIAGITTVNSTGYMKLPVGPTEYRGGRGRGILGGGNTPTVVNTIDYITISTLGNASDFGDLNAVNSETGSFASSTHGFFAGGLNPSTLSTITRVTTSSTGNSFTFGELDSTYWGGSGLSDTTRGIYGRGRDPSSGSNVDTYEIQYINMSSGGKTSFFGNLSDNKLNPGTCASPTRGIFFAGGSPRINNIEFITISTLGNAQEFGDALTPIHRIPGISNTIRGVFGGGYISGTPASISTNVISYITIASTGDAIDFGDLTQDRYSAGGVCSSTRGVFMGGLNVATPVYTRVNTIDYITITSTGNASDFGDLTQGRATGSSFSDAHGGLG